MDTGTIVTLFKFKRWADTETLQAIQRVDTSANAEKHHLMLRLMNHGKRTARTVLTGMCYSVGSVMRQGSSSLTRLT
ncbi:hypothetical protein L8R46_24595, partial [Enterobacter roggenkampii]|nr:hypothetical protein [Enterobacter roggenkampii]